MDGGFPYPWISNQTRIIFPATAEHSKSRLDFVIASKDHVDLGFQGHLF
jgi:hypothetical protein